MSVFNLILATGSDFTDYALLESKLDTLLVDKHPHVRLHLGFSDPSLILGHKFAARYGYEVVEHPGGFRGMERQLQAADAVVAFTTGKSFGITKLIEAGERRGLKVKRVVYIPDPAAKKLKRPIIVAGEELIPEIKERPTRKKLPPADPGWKIPYRKAHEAWFAKEYPATYRDGHYIEPNYPDPRTTNGITAIIINHLKHCGHYSNRQNVQGRQIGGITKTASGATFDDRKWIKSSTRKGASDIIAAINGKMIAIEVKNANTKDRIRDNQVKEKSRVEKSGAVYVVITSVNEFFSWYDRYLITQTKLF